MICELATELAVNSMLAIVGSADDARAEENLEELEALASRIPRGIPGVPHKWFEMDSTIGWEKMMLVFGYADNLAACKNLKTIANAESPDRDFRCRPAN